MGKTRRTGRSARRGAEGPAASGSPRARAAKTASSPSRPRSRKLSPCTSTPSAGLARHSYSSRAGSPTATAASARFSPLHTGGRHPRLDQPHTLRRFLFTWLKTQGIDDALIQLYSGHATGQAPEIYSRLTLADAQKRSYDAIGDFAA
jgi:integrase